MLQDLDSGATCPVWPSSMGVTYVKRTVGYPYYAEAYMICDQVRAM